jgi:hypothetical protein
MSEPEKYLELAAKAREDAAKAVDPVVRDGFLDIAEQYEAMAKDAGRISRRFGSSE